MIETDTTESTDKGLGKQQQALAHVVEDNNF